MTNYAYDYGQRARYTSAGWAGTASSTWDYGWPDCDNFEKEEPKEKVIVEVTVEGELKRI